jgi:hypothetical protein
MTLEERAQLEVAAHGRGCTISDVLRDAVTQVTVDRAAPPKPPKRIPTYRRRARR